jgi:hypothetical protein
MMPSVTAIAESPETAELAPAPPRWLPTDAWLRVLLVPALVFIALASNTAYLADFWHHLARGRLIVTEGHLLDHDVFTFTAGGQSFQDVNWLSQVVYFLLFDQGGLALVRVVNAFIMALALGLLVRLCYTRCGSRSAAMAIGTLTFLGLWQVLTIRPQTFSMLLFVILYDMLERSERQPRLLLVAPFLMALWANLHGAFPAGLMLVGCFLIAAAVLAWFPTGKPRVSLPLPSNSAGRRAWILTWCLGACILATLANPYGWQIYLYVGTTSNRAAARGIDEWVPPSFDQAIGVAFFLSLLLLATLIALTVVPVFNRQRLLLDKRTTGSTPLVGLSDIILALCFLPLAAGSVRMVAWWLLAMAPLAAVFLAKLLPAPRMSENKPTLGAGVSCAVLLLLAVFSVPGLQDYNPLLAFRPKETTERDLDTILERVLHERGAGRIFTRFEWGEYFTWAADRRVSVFMDGRIEIYSDKVWSEYKALTTGQDWAPILDGYHVGALILDSDYHARTGLLAKVADSPKWVKVLQAGKALLYLRR